MMVSKHGGFSCYPSVSKIYLRYSLRRKDASEISVRDNDLAMADDKATANGRKTSGGLGGGGALGDLVKAESMIQLAIALPVGCGVGFLLGDWGDHHWHQGWMAVTGLILGAIGGFYADHHHRQPLHEAGRVMDGLAGNLTDEDVKGALRRALRLLAIIALLGAALFWWRSGWQSALLLLVGAGISGASLWEWLRLMTAIMVRMDGGGKANPMGLIVAGFLLRLGLTFGLAYVSLKYLNGSVYAMALGLGLGVFSLSVEGLRLMKQWSV